MSLISDLRRLIVLVAACWFPVTGFPVLAGDERRIMKDEIHELLADAKVVGEGFEQTFGDPRGHESASTTYREGNNASFGQWRVQADKYCSVWGNPDYWTCYEVYVIMDDGVVRVTWVDDSKRRFTGTLVSK